MSDLGGVARGIWASRVPEGLWLAFALGNLCWMTFDPSWAMLPYHLTWVSLLLLYGLGIRSWSRTLMWCLVAPVMVATGMMLLDPAISSQAPYDELIELPMMVILLLVMTRLTNHRKAAMEQLNAVSQHNVALLEQQREFVQNASHELRTPVTVALAHAELAQHAAPAQISPDVSIVIDELGRMRRLVDDLLKLATVQMGSSTTAPPLALAGFVENAVRRWRVIPRTWEMPVLEDVRVRIDQHRLEAAVDALFENAVRFTSDGDRIDVTVARDDMSAIITVADSGPGIPEDQRLTVLERFRRGNSSPTELHRGNAGGNFGLGLSIVKVVADSAGGGVVIGPSDLGGASVSIHLPALEASAPDRAASSLTSDPGDAPDPLRPALT